MKLGDGVRQVVPAPIAGTIVGATVDADTNRLLLVEWTDGEGVVHRRYFAEAEIDLADPQ